ncbi:peptidoglycan-binding protein [Umezawaea sp. NPDC059074]|uniref:peptidoglycan-binding protein n=1 Tax=Umezawaea sp. NPDC059074 TaxID=3346716 RepID=UPI003679B67C
MSETAVGPNVLRRRRHRRLLVLSGALVVVCTAGTVAFTEVAARPHATPSSATPPAVAAVTRTDLVDRIKVDGALGHGATTPLAGRKAGTITSLPRPGAVIGRGEQFYAVDEVGVPLLFGTIPMYRDLAEGAKPGEDVRMVQENLLALGFTDLGQVDGVFGRTTVRALRQWQKARGVKQTGVLAASDVVVVPGPVRVDGVTARLGGPGEGDLVTVTGTDRLVTAVLDEAQRRYAPVDGVVGVELPDRTVVPGRVREVGPKQVDGKTQLVATVALDDPGAAPDAGRVTVTLDGERRAGVLVVPVRALVALKEGGYAVETVDPRRFLAVALGMFADGRVEVTGDGLADGLKVVTAS